MALVGGYLLFLALQPAQGQSDGSPSPSASATTTASAPASRSPAPPPSTPPEPAERTVTGSALGIASFTPTGGDCPSLTAFTAAFDFRAVEGALTLTQLGIDHVSTGTIEDGAYSAAGPGQVTEGTITGTSFSGTVTDSGGGCTGIYAFDGDLTRPFTSGPPLADVPGYFEVLVQGTGAGGLGLPEPGQSVHLIVASELIDVTSQLPIRVVGTSGGDTFWDFTIEGDPALVCRGPTGCSADAPTPVDASWADGQPVIIATGAGGDRIAVMAPQGAPTALLPTPSPSPTVEPTATPAAAAPTVTPAEAGPRASPAPSTATTADGGPNLPLAAAGTVLLVAGGGLAFVGPGVVGGLVTRRRDRTAATSVEEQAAAYIADDVAVTQLVGRAWKATTADTGSGVPVGLLAAGAAVLIVALLGGIALATGVFGGRDGTTVASPTHSAQATTAPVTSTPTAEPTAERQPVTAALTDLGLWDPGVGLVADADGGNYSIPDVAAGYFPPYVDVIGSGAVIVDAAEAAVTEGFNASVFDCDEAVDGVLTVCASGAEIPAGPLLVAVAQMAEVVPQASEDGLLTYALVVRADTDPANDYAAQPPFTDDFYQGTDRWYELTWADASWTLSVDRGETASGARAAIRDDAIVFFVPMSELGVELPPFRLTAFASSDASFEAATSGGDVAPGPPAGEWTVVEPFLAPAAASRLFLDQFAPAVRAGDEAFLYDRLHPAVIERYGEATCRAYAAVFEDAAFELTPIDAAPPAPWDYVSDERTTTIADAWAVLASTVVDGAPVERDFHFAPIGPTIRWFTDCGEPVG